MGRRANPLIVALAICAASVCSIPFITDGAAQFNSGGSAGPQGSAGINGAQTYPVTSIPSNAVGSNGDLAVDSVSGSVYLKSSGAWAYYMSLIGPAGSTGAAGVAGTNGTNGTNGSAGATGATGATGSTGGFTGFGQPSSRTFALATAYQCTDNTKPCILTVTLTSTAALSLSGGTTNTADVIIGTTSGIATSGGTRIAQYSNSLTGTLTITLAANTTSNATYTVNVPAAGFFAVRGTSGTVTVVNSSVEQTVS